MSLLGDARELAVDHGLWWPSGDPGRLRHLADEWRHRGREFEDAGSTVLRQVDVVPVGNFGAVVDAFVEHASLLAVELDDHVDRCRQMARALEDRADQIEAARRRIDPPPPPPPATVATGFLLTVFTGGLSDVAAADLTAALIADAAALGITCSEAAAAIGARVAVYAVLGAWESALTDVVGQSTRHLVQNHHPFAAIDLHEVATVGAFGGAFGGMLGFLSRPPGPLPPLPKVAVRVPPLDEAWAAGKGGSVTQNAIRHFRSHGRDFAEVEDLDAYVRRAWEFLHGPPDGTITFTRTNGDVVRFHPESNTFGIMDPSGVPRTFYKPDPTLHGRTTNLEYFYDQRW